MATPRTHALDVVWTLVALLLLLGGAAGLGEHLVQGLIEMVLGAVLFVAVMAYRVRHDEPVN